MRILKLTLVTIAMLVFQLSLIAQKIDLNSKIPVDPDVKTGKLKNGITYYIKKNAKPEKRVELRLAVNAGSICENDDQLGLAHFVEHLCFNGTKNFKKNELIDFLEKAGVKFGAHLNAYTSFDETVYMLQLPTDKPDLMDKAYQVLEDWAHQVALEDEEIEKERGVIIEEWRLGLGADERMRQKYFPVLLKNSRYAERLPIGKKEIVENVKPELIRNFYKDWYRPDLMAVVVVGDIDIEQTEKKIIQHFGSIPGLQNPRERVEYEIPDNEEPLVCVASDKENTYTVIQMFIKHPNEDPSTVKAYRNSLMAQLYNGMINNRLNEITQKPDAPFLYAGSSFGGFLGRTKSAYTLFTVPKENKINEALEIIVAENEKVKRFGFTKSELEREKKKLLVRYDQLAKEADKTESSSLAREYVSNYLTQEPIPGIKTENEYAQAFVPEITLDEINALAKKWITDKNLAMIVLVKEGEGIIIPEEEDLLAVIKSTREKKYEAYVDEDSEESLMTEMPKSSKIISRTENKKFGTTELIFSNQVKVILKPTDFKNDEILFSGFAPGGISMFNDNEIVAATYMASVMNTSGFGNFDNIALNKKLAGNTAKLRLTMGKTDQGLSGNAAPKDLETLLQLNYQYFTSARKDDKAFQTFVSTMQNQIKFMSASPEMAFYDKMVKVTSSNNPRIFLFPPTEQLEKLKVEDVYAVYEKAYKTANNYTFVMVGNFEIDKIAPLLETYLGGLPTSQEKRNFVDRKIIFPAGVTKEVVNKGKEQKSSVAMVFNGSWKWSDKNLVASRLLLHALKIKLRESMREEQGGVYGVSANINLEILPKTTYDISVNWGCSPENVEKLINTVLEEMKKMVDNGPTDTDIEKAKETFIKERETDVKENQFWLSYLKSRNQIKQSPLTFEEYKALVGSISKSDLQKLAKAYFKPNHYVRVVLMPEEVKEGK